MSHYEERLEADLGAIRRSVAEVGARVDDAIRKSVHSLLHRDRALASETVLGDLPINRATRGIDRACHAFVARHVPSAGPLRFVSSVLRLSIALERMGDYAVTIAREAVQLAEKPPASVIRDIEMIDDQSRKMLVQALKAFDEGNAELARGTMPMSSQVHTTFGKVYADLLAEGEAGSCSVRDLLGLLVVFNRLERIGDQAKNICEETIFAATGETKTPKVYKILFLDETNGWRSPLAEALARRAFPESGQYSSAGWSAAPSHEPGLKAFLDARGLAVDAPDPLPLERVLTDLDDYHIVIGLEPGVWDRLGEVPFHTVVLEWSLEAGRGASGDAVTEELLESISRELSVKIRDLMETARGEGAG